MSDDRTCQVCENITCSEHCALCGHDVQGQHFAEATLARVRNARARLDGHTWSDQTTDADVLVMYRQFVAELDRVLS